MRAPTMLRKKVTVHYAAVPVGARIARPRFVLDDWILSANERIAEFLDFAIQAKFAYVNKNKKG